MSNQNEFLDLETGIEEFTNHNITATKKYNYKGLYLIALSIVLLIIQTQLGENDSLRMGLIIGFMFALSIGLILFFVKKTQYLTKDGKNLKLYEISFDAARTSEVLSFYNSGKFSELINIDKSASIVAIKFLCDDAFTTIYSQVFKFIPYKLEPCTNIKLHDAKDSEEVRKLIKARG